MPEMLEAGVTHWYKSSRSSGNGACVEVAFIADAVAVRDSKDPQGTVLVFAHASWRAFIELVRRGALDQQ
jgi:hypothetical protein